MCEFVSWIECRGEILFLTDAEVFSSHGKDVLQSSRGIDFLGHGAIRAFYGIQQGVGREQEERRFWDIALFPEPIRKKLEEGFDANWGKMFQFFRMDDLFWILQNHPDVSWKRRVFEELKKRGIGINDLLDIIHEESVPDDLRLEAFEELKKCNLRENNLFNIICGRSVPDNLKWEALKELKKPRFSYESYFFGIIYGQFIPDDLKRKAFKNFKKRDIDTEDLFDIICGQFIPDDLKRGAFREFKKRNFDECYLFDILRDKFVPDDLKRGAFNKLKKFDPDKEDILAVINDEDVPEDLREKAKKLLQAKPL